MFLGQLTRDREGWGRAREESPAPALGTAAAMAVLLTSDPVRATSDPVRAEIQAAKAKGRERLRKLHMVPGTPKLSLSRAQ